MGKDAVCLGGLPAQVYAAVAITEAPGDSVFLRLQNSAFRGDFSCYNKFVPEIW